MKTPLISIQDEKVIVSSCKPKWITSNAENDKTENCWDQCRGGKCSHCDINGNEGYCCRQDSGTFNGLCPDQAILASSTFHHSCVHGRLNNKSR